jgi:hypothetical protein
LQYCWWQLDWSSCWEVQESSPCHVLLSARVGLPVSFSATWMLLPFY